jgi:hypothetical protein
VTDQVKIKQKPFTIQQALRAEALSPRRVRCSNRPCAGRAKLRHSSARTKLGPLRPPGLLKGFGPPFLVLRGPREVSALLRAVRGATAIMLTPGLYLAYTWFTPEGATAIMLARSTLAQLTSIRALRIHGSCSTFTAEKSEGRGCGWRASSGSNGAERNWRLQLRSGRRQCRWWHLHTGGCMYLHRTRLCGAGACGRGCGGQLRRDGVRDGVCGWG